MEFSVEYKRRYGFNAAVPVARIINQKVAQGYIRRAQILFMKVKWEHQNAARKAWGSTCSMGPQPVSNEALAES